MFCVQISTLGICIVMAYHWSTTGMFAVCFLDVSKLLLHPIPIPMTQCHTKPSPVALKLNQLDFRWGFCSMFISLLLISPWLVPHHRRRSNNLLSSSKITWVFHISGFQACIQETLGWQPPGLSWAPHEWTDGIPAKIFQGTPRHYFGRWGLETHATRSKVHFTSLLEQASVDVGTMVTMDWKKLAPTNTTAQGGGGSFKDRTL